MAFLLDTNVVSELRRPRPHADLHLASVTIGEIQAGIELTRDQEFNTLSSLPMDGMAFRCWATLMHRQSDTLYEDAMITAIAKVHPFTVVTRNVADFSRFDANLFNPFNSESGRD